MINMCNDFNINTCDETNIFWPWVWTLFTRYTNDENDGYLDCIFVYRSVIMMKWLNSWWLWLYGLYTNDETIRYLATDVINIYDEMDIWGRCGLSICTNEYISIWYQWLQTVYIPMLTSISDDIYTDDEISGDEIIKSSWIKEINIQLNTPTLCLALGPYGVNAMCPTPSYTVISCWPIVNQASCDLRTVFNFMCQAIGNIIRHPNWFLMRCFSLTFSDADISCKLFLVLELISDKKSLILYIQSSYHIPPPKKKIGKILGCLSV